VLIGALTGDPVQDRGHLIDLATWLTASGNLEAAIEVLDSASSAFPNDPTFLLAAATRLDTAGRFTEALDRADRAMPLSWGGNRLRVAAARSTALVGLGRTEEAREFVAATLAEIPAPPDDLDVRSNRYRRALEATVATPVPAR
jgi:tetratricopeptide (TPR) repeat protein